MWTVKFLKINIFKVFYHLCILRTCSSFVLLTSAASSGQNNGYVEFKQDSTVRRYQLNTITILNEAGVEGKDVGYRISSNLDVTVVWKGAEHETLMKFKWLSPKLLIKSRKAPTPDDFIEHSSYLDSYKNNPFYVFWNRGVIQNVYVDEKEPISIINYKKGIASLFQFQILDVNTNETDVSGFCEVSYISISPKSFRKIKKHCDLPFDYSTTFAKESLPSVALHSDRLTTYTLSDDLSSIQEIHADEQHEMRMALKRDAGNKVKISQNLILKEKIPDKSSNIVANTAQDAIREIELVSGLALKNFNLELQRELQQCTDDCPTLVKLVKDHREVLKSGNLGTVKSAMTFLKLLTIARTSSSNEIQKALKGTKNKEILQQLLDIIGYAQTIASHQAAKKFLNFDNEYDVDNAERYLWALSIGNNPKEEVINDILRMSEVENTPPKLSETLLLTAAAMANKYAKIPRNGPNNMVTKKVENIITYELGKCLDDSCQMKYLRALKNLAQPSAIHLLQEKALKGKPSISVAAMKALNVLPKEQLNTDTIKACERILYQLGKRYDSSARTIALDIILESNPSAEILKDLVLFLASSDKEYEVKQFLIQKLQMVSDRCPKFQSMLKDVLRTTNVSRNWHVLGQKGLTTVLSRSVMSNPWSNASLISVQEISGGLLKRGHVDVVLQSVNGPKELFSLGLFAGGLTGLMGSDSENPPLDDDPTTAGMELTVQGVQIRPFVFFNGQGELMGHVWSGTASDRTTAFQALSLLQDYSQLIPLGSGTYAELNLLSAASFDLAAQIQLSIWSRVAHSLVEKNAGIIVLGTLKADTSFVHSQVEFILGLEPKLNLISDIDFYSDISLCIQVTQPDLIMKHNVHKIETIPGSKHKLRKSQYRTVNVPGRTYALNRKNSVMCNAIHNKM